nr:MAG TPA: helix-turn-helix domain-containing protein [Caudoviricetes sp.]
MKSVLISIQPKWCEKIASGKKTIEVRKTAPKEVPFKAYIYCTKDKPYLYRVDDDNNFELTNTLRPKTYEYVKDYNEQNGKIIGEFVCRGIMQPFYSLRLIAKESCLTEEELLTYSKGKPLYGLRIADLKIYDKPKELSEFFKPCPTKEKGDCLSCDCLADNDYGGVCTNNLTRPPQSYMFVEEIETR